MQRGDHPVAQKGVAFLRGSVRPDGSWPIDTDLATWVSTLSVKALASQPGALLPEQRLTLREWLLGQQYRAVHPYTHAKPGGWAWTELPGGVPDADDTAGALLALLSLGTLDGPMTEAGIAGVRWLLSLQNRDGGVPTFCRGWGALPFDRSSQDITAHALRAWSAWRAHVPESLQREVDRAVSHGLAYLQKNQRPDGSWLPLWFGNEHAPDDENPTYGTAHVLLALRELRERAWDIPRELTERGERALVALQNADGGWGGVRGGPSSVEETSLALEALAGLGCVSAVDAGAAWLSARVLDGAWCEPAPIGFYFARLWYFEKLYPQIWTVGALGRLASFARLGV
jgi:squalene-hopene/tetraprenyl-beta-curcumene cyclase